MSRKRGKLRLDLDGLQVESFATASKDVARGTVRGHVTFWCPDNSPSDTDCTDCLASDAPCPTGATVCYVCTNTNTRQIGCSVV